MITLDTPGSMVLAVQMASYHCLVILTWIASCVHSLGFRYGGAIAVADSIDFVKSSVQEEDSIVAEAVAVHIASAVASGVGCTMHTLT